MSSQFEPELRKIQLVNFWYSIVVRKLMHEFIELQCDTTEFKRGLKAKSVGVSKVRSVAYD